MLGATYTGIFSGNNSFLVTPQCPSGNCTWEDTYTTLGVCSQCYDITDELVSRALDTKYSLSGYTLHQEYLANCS
jgi:hypothetical protein